MSQEIQITSKVKTSKNGTNIQYDFSSVQDMDLNNAYQYSSSLTNAAYTLLQTGSFTPNYVAVKNLSTASIALTRASNGTAGFAILKNADSIVIPHSGSEGYYARTTSTPATVMVVIVGT